MPSSGKESKENKGLEVLCSEDSSPYWRGAIVSSKV